MGAACYGLGLWRGSPWGARGESSTIYSYNNNIKTIQSLTYDQEIEPLTPTYGPAWPLLFRGPWL